MNAQAKKPFLILLIGTWTVADAIDVAVPNELAEVEGNAASLYPFLIRQTGFPSMRYQQVYDAAQFTAVTPPGAYITHILLRPDGAAWGAIGSSTNIQINFSTTLKAPDSLSEVFAENVGADDTLVLGPATFDVGSSGGSMPNSWGFQIPLAIPFWYSPARGNLLLDVRIYRSGPPFSLNLALDAQSATNDSVSSVYSDSVNATSANTVESTGLITLFLLSPIPSLEIDQTTNSIVITWPREPKVFVIESTDKLGPQSNWQQVTDEIVETPPLRTLTLPRDSLGATKFFRLIWESGRLASQGSVAPPPESKSIAPNTH